MDVQIYELSLTLYSALHILHNTLLCTFSSSFGVFRASGSFCALFIIVKHLAPKIPINPTILCALLLPCTFFLCHFVFFSPTLTGETNPSKPL